MTLATDEYYDNSKISGSEGEDRPRGIEVDKYNKKQQADGVGMAMSHPTLYIKFHKLGDVTPPPELYAGGYLPLRGTFRPQQHSMCCDVCGVGQVKGAVHPRLPKGQK